MRLFLAQYRLRNGSRGTLHLICAASFDAIDIALDTFGDQLARISVRPAA
jgi:hypothetical protein